ncbi:MAG: hypothetical protein HFE44_00170 [Oscillospiraceae bacterium]|jgi:uncharacterized membrane protein SirB2|nr:hypothetical protein [Oscillospiraceae bacterium]
MKPEENQEQNKNVLFIFLKGLSVAFQPLCVLPLLALSGILLNGGVFGWPQMATAFLGVLLAGAGGALVGGLLCLYAQRPSVNENVTKFLRVMMFISAPVFSLAITLLLWPQSAQIGAVEWPGLPPDFAWLIFLLANTAVLAAGWTLTARNMPGSYTTSFALNHLVRGALVYVISMGFIYFYGSEIPIIFNISTLSLPFGLMVVMALILLNQGNIDSMMERRRHNKASLPGRIRVYNLIMVSGILAVIFVSLLFGNQIFAALVWVGKRLLLLVVYIVMGILWLLGRGQQDGDAGAGEGKQDTAIYEQLARGASTNPWWNILYLVLIGLAVYLLVSNRKAIFRSIRDWFSRIGAAIYNFLMGRFQFRDLGAEEGYYTDDVEVLTQDDRPQESAAFHNKRELKKALKQWQKVTDPVQKVRDGYRLMVMTSKTGESGVVSSDTTGQILGKNRETPMEPIFKQMNPVYDRVRYGDIAPSAEEVSAVGKEIEAAFESGGVAMKNLAGQMEREKKSAREAAKNVRKK